MGQKLDTSPDSKPFPPGVNVRGEKNQYFVGKLLAHRVTKSKWKKEDGSDRMQDIFEFAIEDTDMEITKKENGTYVPANVNVGDTVSIMAPSRLSNGLRKATVGQTIRIQYLGLGRAFGKGGKPHTYDVEVL